MKNNNAMQTLITLLFKFFAALPLPLLHKLGNAWGALAYCLLRKDRERVYANMTQAGLHPTASDVRAVFQETAKGALELPVAFFRRPEAIETLFTKIHGWEHVQSALENGEGLLLITPHLGSYDLAGRYISQQLPFPLTAMYKPPKIKAFDAIMQAGRVRGKGKTAPTNLHGVKQVIKALRAGEATIVLPDHVPAPEEGGDGVWAEFFGQPAFTMTLAGKLAQVKGVKTLFFCGERLPDGKGFALHIEPPQGELNGDKQHDAQTVNRNVEYWIRRFPQQYLFMYNRYKHPAGAPLPPAPSQSFDR
ncbi:KDO2-lipid IV(A) lauroyltransferase [Neisseria perflava]|nr:KDO2-lipid IV(A) lauroyltransferase [Neisseria perflava]